MLAVSFCLKLQRMFYLLFITSEGKCNHMDYAIKSLTSLVKGVARSVYNLCEQRDILFDVGERHNVHKNLYCQF